MTLTTWIILAVVSLIFSGLFSGTEIAFITSDRVRMELDVKSGGFLAKTVGRFYADPNLFISTILVGNNVMLVIYGMGAAALLDPWIESWCTNQAVVLILSTLISTAVILLVGEFFPKSIFRINPYTSLKIFAIPVAIFYVILYPVSIFSSWLSTALMRLFGVKADSSRVRMLTVGDLNQYLEKTIDEVNPEKTDRKSVV